jgi:hypothetical protein
MKGLLDWFSRFRARACLRPLADEIANRCHREICQRVWTMGLRLPMVEARGYVRVRAQRVIRREVEAALYRQKGWRRQQREQLFQWALQRAVANAALELSRARSENPASWRDAA